jgi:prolyl 4-hydroxylase
VLQHCTCDYNYYILSMLRVCRMYWQVLDPEARIFLWEHFLSDEECDYIKAQALPRLERSGVVDSNTGADQARLVALPLYI